MKRFIALSAVLALVGPVFGDSFAVKIDPQKTGTPISKYIYGQFIEHLGRSIYGGIWAEMLEDRKFCYPISDTFDPFGTTTDKDWDSGPYEYLKGSPWKVIGPAGTVTMDKDHAYVGEQSPVIHLAADGAEYGISQSGLAVVKGKKYGGHIVLAGEGVTQARVELTFPGDKSPPCVIDNVSSDFTSYPIEFAPASSSDDVTITIVAKGTGTLRIGAISLMPADNIKGFRADTITCLKQLNAPIYRWPGGNFVSGYNWRDGINPNRDMRPPRKNPAWKNIEHNDVGLHEYMDLLELIGAEPYIAVNTGLGTPEEAAAEMEYVLGTTNTPMGELRGKNGHPEPWKAKYWAVGNEMFGTWQLGYMPLEKYEQKHIATVNAMRKVDPEAVLVASGDTGTAGWDKGMLSVCANYMNLISEHVYCKENPDPSEHALLLPAAIKRVADAHREFRKTIPEIAGKDIRISMDEWNFWYGKYAYGELGTQYRLKDALGVAMGFHEYYRNSDLFFMANYAQTVNVLGAIKTSRTAASLESTGQVLALYRAHFGVVPIVVDAQPSPDLDVSAAWTEDKTAITVAIVNHTKRDHEVVVDLGGVALKPEVMQWEIKGSDSEAYNEPGKTPVVAPVEHALKISGNTLAAPGQSVEIYRLERQ